MNVQEAVQLLSKQMPEIRRRFGVPPNWRSSVPSLAMKLGRTATWMCSSNSLIGQPSTITWGLNCTWTRDLPRALIWRFVRTSVQACVPALNVRQCMSRENGIPQ